MPVYKPMDINPLVTEACKFLEPIPKESRVLILLNDPGNAYEKLFDGFRQSLELLFYAGIKKNITIFPNWQAIFKNNTTSAPGFWIKEGKSLQALSETWDFDFVIFDKQEFAEIYSNQNVITRHKLDLNLQEHDHWSQRTLRNPSWEIAKLS